MKFPIGQQSFEYIHKNGFCYVDKTAYAYKLADEGKSILFISSEISEMLRTCSRMAIMRDGEKVGELDHDLTQESVMRTIAGGEQKS